MVKNKGRLKRKLVCSKTVSGKQMLSNSFFHFFLGIAEDKMSQDKTRGGYYSLANIIVG